MNRARHIISALFITCIIMVIMTCSKNTIAQAPGVVNFSAKNGLPSDNAYTLRIDRDGYVWIGTEGGVAKYNGYTYKTFTTSEGLPSNDIWKIVVDEKNRVWPFSLNYKFGYIQNDKYQNVYKDSIGFRPIHVKIIDGTTYFAIRYEELNSWRLIELKNTSTGFSTEKFDMDDKNMYMYILADDFTSYSIDYDNNLYQWNPLTQIPFKKVCALPGLNKVLHNRYQKPTVTKPGLIVSHAFKGDNAVFLEVDKCSAKILTLSDFGKDNGYIYLCDIFHQLQPDSTKLRFHLTTNNHNYILDSNGKVLDDELYTQILPDGVQVSVVIEDKFNGRWYTTNQKGIWYKPAFYNAFRKGDNGQVFSDAELLYATQDGCTYWWRKNMAQLYQLDTNGNTKLIPLPRNSWVYKIIGNPKDSKIYISDVGALYIYDRKKEKLSYYLKGKNYIHNNQTAIDDNKFLMNQNDIGSSSLLQLTTGNDTLYTFFGKFFTKLYTVGDSAVFEYYFRGFYKKGIYDKTNGVFWFYNEANIHMVNLQESKMTDIGVPVIEGLGINDIRSLATDRFGNLYIYNNDKITVFNPKKQSFINLAPGFNIKNGQIKVYGDMLIVAGEFGIGCAEIKGPLSVADFSVVANTKQSLYKRVQGLEVLKPTNEILINTDNGVYYTKIDAIVHNRYALKPKTDPIFNIVIKQQGEKDLGNTDTISIYQDEQQKINIDVVNYYGSGEVKYKYNIDGIYSEWQESLSGEVLLGDLKPGVHYNINIIAEDAVWNSGVQTYKVYIVPYWWQTKTWKSIFWVAAVVLFALFVIFIIQTTKRISEKTLERKQQMTDLELRALYAQINPHFIFNTLGTALYFIDKKDHEGAYVHVSKFSRLLRSYLKSTQERYISLADEITMLRNYIELQQTRFEERFSYSVEVDNKLPLDNIFIPSLLLQPLVENAINHGLFHSKDVGKLTLRFYQGKDNEELICEIEDNGVGRDKAREIKKESSTRQESYGTKLTKELIEIFKEYEKVNIHLQYIDIEGEETGTIARLTIKNLKYVA